MATNLEILLDHIEIMSALRDAGVVFSDDDAELFKIFGIELLRFEKFSVEFAAELDSGNFIRAAASRAVLKTSLAERWLGPESASW
jgi:hypothetical protein